MGREPFTSDCLHCNCNCGRFTKQNNKTTFTTSDRPGGTFVALGVALGTHHCAALAEALESNGRIRELSLRGNNMGDIGARALRGNINENNRLSKIDVSDNGIGESGGVDLGLLITSTKSLKQADFSCAAFPGPGRPPSVSSSSLLSLHLRVPHARTDGTP